VSPLHLNIPKGIMFSYVDDFTVTVASLSYRRNVQRLQHYFSALKRRASAIGMSFSVPKTELTHWRTSRDHGARCYTPVTLDGTLFHPAGLVRWLGYWFTPSLETSPHFAKRLALAQGAFAIVRQLSPPGKGLPPYLNRRLAVGLILPILSYGADLLVPNASSLHKMEVFWNRVLRWVTNCFHSTPTSILPCEASIPPLVVLLPHKRRMAALRMACSPPEINPAAARLPSSFPSASATRAPDSNRALSTGLKGNAYPLLWKTPRPSPAVRSHLPIDGIAHSIARIAAKGTLPGLNRHLVPGAINNLSSSQQYSLLKSATRSLLSQDWALQAPPPPYYPYPPPEAPHPFMGLERFLAGRIHQMRAGKSYLAAHTPWNEPDKPTTCPACGLEPETMQHAILSCPSKATSRLLHIPGVDSLGGEASLWTDKDLLWGLARYISETKTNFPPAMGRGRASPGTNLVSD
jgi:hypothetical protein